MTNADKVRNMADEELAVVLMCPYGRDGINCQINEQGLSCNECCLDWLRGEGERKCIRGVETMMTNYGSMEHMRQSKNASEKP